MCRLAACAPQGADRAMCVEIWFEYEREDQHEQEHEQEHELEQE
jgi:hypothetical protein